MSADYYAELGLGRKASDDEIKKAYRKLASELHPDRNPGKPQIEERFKRVNSAYHVLSDEKKRKLYDEFGEAGLREGFDPNMNRGRGGGFEDIFGGGGAGIGDLFGDLFGGGGRGRRSPRKSPDVESEIAVEFVSAVKGAELELSVGGRPVKVRIPEGAENGDKLRVRGGGGSQHPSLPPGDLLLTLRVKGHPHFERDGLDLTVELPISVKEAYSGGKVDVPTTTGQVTLKVPPHTQSGQLLRLREKGVKRGSKIGDLYVRFMIQLPILSTPEIEKAVEALDTNLAAEKRADLKF